MAKKRYPQIGVRMSVEQEAAIFALAERIGCSPARAMLRCSDAILELDLIAALPDGHPDRESARKRFAEKLTAILPEAASRDWQEFPARLWMRR